MKYKLLDGEGLSYLLERLKEMFSRKVDNTTLDARLKTDVPENAKFTDTIVDISGKVDKVTGMGLSANSYTTAEKNKLSGIEEGANKYTHPTNHSIDMITESTTGKVMTASERTKLSGISTGATKVENSLINGNIKIDETEAKIYTHPAGTNPHGTTKSDVGLANVDNVKQATKAEFDAHNHTLASLSERSYNSLTNKPNLGSASSRDVGTSSGEVPILDSKGKLDDTIIPKIAISETSIVANQTAMLALTAEVGDICVRTDLSKSFILKEEPASVLANWQELLTPLSPVQSVAGKQGVVTLNKSDVGLANLDNVQQATKTEFNNHKGDNTHITMAERSSWNAKETTSGAQSKADTALTGAKEYVDNKVKTDVPAGAKFTDTTYDVATASTNGLMSATDKQNVDSNIGARHTHTNKVVIDKFSDVGGKPYYNGNEIGGAVPNLTLNELTLGDRFKISYNDIEDSLDIEVV